MGLCLDPKTVICSDARSPISPICTGSEALGAGTIIFDADPYYRDNTFSVGTKKGYCRQLSMTGGMSTNETEECDGSCHDGFSRLTKLDLAGYPCPISGCSRHEICPVATATNRTAFWHRKSAIVHVKRHAKLVEGRELTETEALGSVNQILSDPN